MKHTEFIDSRNQLSDQITQGNSLHSKCILVPVNSVLEASNVRKPVWKLSDVCIEDKQLIAVQNI